VKALDSPWRIKDRSNNWLKIKPDYGTGFEIDCLILGAYFGTGRQGSKVSLWG
jgi:ATP-dependent DNA ligase